MIKLKIVISSPFTGINNGWAHRYINLIKGIMDSFSISLFIPGQALKLKEELPSVTIYNYPSAIPERRKYSLLRLVKSYLFPERTQIFLPAFKYYPEYDSFINQIEIGSDVTLYFGLDSLIYYGQEDISPLIFCDFCDSIARFMHNQIKHKKRNPILGYIDLLYLKRIKRFFVPRQIKVLAITELDGAFINKMLPENDSIVIPNGIKIPEKKVDLKTKFESEYLIFVGALNYMPNIDSVKFIFNKVWPEISSRFKNIKLLIVGRNPISEIVSFGENDSRVSIKANVADVFPFIQMSKLLLCPMFLGGGLKNKILEALATSTPILTNKEGSIGIPIENNIHGFIAESPVDMISAISKILNMSFDRYERMASNCYEMAKKFTWNAVSEKMIHAINHNYCQIVERSNVCYENK